MVLFLQINISNSLRTLSLISNQLKFDIQEITDDISEPQVIDATRIGSFTLTRRLKQQICNGMQLNDLHIEAYQSLVQSKFPLLGGQSTVCQNSHPLNLKAIHYQIILVRSNHWALLQIIEDEANQPNVSIYDSAYDDVDVKQILSFHNLFVLKESLFHSES